MSEQAPKTEDEVLSKLRELNLIEDMHDKPYITHEGLLRLANFHGLEGIDVSMVDYDPQRQRAIFLATASGPRGTFANVGDADKENVGTKVSKHYIRMGATRAINRALRLYCGIGMCSKDELDDEDTTANRSAPAVTTRKRAAPRPAATTKENHHPSWAEDRTRYHAQLKELGTSYDAVVSNLTERNMGRPSSWTQAERNTHINELSENYTAHKAMEADYNAENGGDGAEPLSLVDATIRAVASGVTGNDKVPCPACGGPMWDNRGEGKSTIFKCKEANGACRHKLSKFDGTIYKPSPAYPTTIWADSPWLQLEEIPF